MASPNFGVSFVPGGGEENGADPRLRGGARQARRYVGKFRARGDRLHAPVCNRFLIAWSIGATRS